MGGIGNYKSGLSSIALKANELRIGNLLFDNKEQLCSVDKLESDIDECGIYAIENATTYLPFHGVLLTEEILLKCGFTKANNIIIGNYQIDISWYDKFFKRISITIEPGNKYLFISEGHPQGPMDYDDTVTLWNGDIKDLFYLHNLQNLYFSLTGEELKIEL